MKDYVIRKIFNRTDIKINKYEDIGYGRIYIETDNKKYIYYSLTSGVYQYDFDMNNITKEDYSEWCLRNINYIMNYKNKTQGDISECLPISQSSVSRYLSGYYDMNINVLLDFCKILNIKIDDILFKDY